MSNNTDTIAQSIIVYLESKNSAGDLHTHAFPGIHEVRVSHDGDISLHDEHGLTVAYYAAGKWVGYHSFDHDEGVGML